MEPRWAVKFSNFLNFWGTRGRRKIAVDDLGSAMSILMPQAFTPTVSQRVPGQCARRGESAARGGGFWGVRIAHR